MDKDLLMDKLFAFLREFQEFENLTDMVYDHRNNLVRAKVGMVEKVILIQDSSSCLSITKDVIEWFAKG